MRNEIKFIIPRKELFKVKEKLINHSFNYVYENRIINNIYFDTSENISFYENIEGLKDRTKYRIRWYGNFELEHQKKVILECKIKNNSLGWKDSLIIKFDFNLSYSDRINMIINKIKKSRNNFYKPVVTNKYLREYLEDPEGVRITIDSDIKYSNNESLKKITDKNLILEVKFKINNSFNSELFNELDVMLSKNSKFVNGRKHFI